MKAAAAPQPPLLIKPIWRALIGPAWVVALVFYFVVAAVRYFAFLSPYELQHIFFLQTIAMWALPFMLLTETGRSAIGLSKHGPSFKIILFSILAGATCALAFFGLGLAIYGNSPDNWDISIRNYLHLEEMRGVMPPFGLFVLYALPAIFLNPLGEELLFRGFMQEAFAQRFSWLVGAVASSISFGLIYLYIHGLTYDASGFHLRAASASVAFCCMALTGAVFTACRKLSRSLWSSMVAHAAFNLALLAAAITRFAR